MPLTQALSGLGVVKFSHRIETKIFSYDDFIHFYKETNNQYLFRTNTPVKVPL